MRYFKVIVLGVSGKKGIIHKARSIIREDQLQEGAADELIKIGKIMEIPNPNGEKDDEQKNQVDESAPTETQAEDVSDDEGAESSPEQPDEESEGGDEESDEDVQDQEADESETEESSEPAEAIKEFDDITKKELQNWLNEHEVVHNPRGNKAELYDLYKANF